MRILIYSAVPGVEPVFLDVPGLYHPWEGAPCHYFREHYVFGDRELAYKLAYWAKYVARCRWPEAEPIIRGDAAASVLYFGVWDEKKH